jgi:adenine-specific DNA-methyltransferase
MTDNLKIDLQICPTTRYQGSKRKLLPWIYKALRDVNFTTVLDAFGGTGSVSYLFKTMGKQVTYNDYLKFNSIIGKSIIENSHIILNDTNINSILSIPKLKEGFISKHFRDIYFLEEENLWIDNIINDLKEIKLCSNKEIEFKKAIALNALFQSCLIKRPFNLFHRKNLYIRTNDVKRNFGNKTTWDQDFEMYFRRFVDEINNSIFNSGIDCHVENKDVFEIDKIDYDLVYLDPPYVLKNSRNESANYLNCYHFLEGMSDYNNWNSNIDYNSKIRNINKSYVKNHFKASIVNETFEQLIYKFNKSKIVISYKFGGLPSIEFLINLLEKNNKKVFTKSLHYKYALNKQNGNAKLNREYLIIGI